MDKVECIVVGAGPSGSACALSLARKGIETVLIERGAQPGEKNVASFILYDNILRDLIPDYEKSAPLERVASADSFVLLSNMDYIDVTARLDNHYSKGAVAYTGYRSKFDRWFAEQAEKEGAELVRGMCVTGLVKENGRVAGVKVGDEELRANVVVGADGFHSVVSREAGLYEDNNLDFWLCIKEVLDLPAKTIDERFRVRENEATMILCFGYPVGDAGGLSTIYPFKDAVGLVLLCPMKGLKEKGVNLRERMEDFKSHPYVDAFIHGSSLREYESHILPIAGRLKLDNLYGAGVLLIGDAGGFQSSYGVGVPPGMLSGITAARAVEHARKKGSYDRETMGIYKDFLFETGLPQMIKSGRSFHKFLLGPGYNHMDDFLEKLLLVFGEYEDSEVDFRSPKGFPLTEKVYEYFMEPYLPNYINIPLKPLVKLTTMIGEKLSIRQIKKKL